MINTVMSLVLELAHNYKLNRHHQLFTLLSGMTYKFNQGYDQFLANVHPLNRTAVRKACVS